MKYLDILKKIKTWQYKIGDNISIDDKEYRIQSIFPMPRDLETKAQFLESYNSDGLELAIERFMNGKVEVGYLLIDSDKKEFLIGSWEI